MDLLPGCAASHVLFRGRDDYSLSDERACLRWGQGQTLDIPFIPELLPGSEQQAVISLSGMPSLFDSHAYVYKFINSLIDIELNGTVIFSGMIHWRSHEETASYWPSFRFQFDFRLLHQGGNLLRLTNRSGRDALGAYYDPQLDQAFSPAVAESKLTTLYLSTVELEYAPKAPAGPRLEGVPASAVTGTVFAMDLVHGASELPARVIDCEQAEITLLETALEFGCYRTPVHIMPLRAGAPIRVVFEIGGVRLACEVCHVFERIRDRSLRAGGGMETVYWHQIPDVLEDGFSHEYGNTFRFSIDDFLNNLHCIAPERWIPVLQYLIRRRRFFALQRLRVPPYTRLEHHDLGRLADLGGEWFSGVSIPEPSLHLGTPGRDRDLKTVLDEYLRFFRQRMEELRLPGHPVVTFDSAGGLSGHYYAAGLDAQLSEVGPACNAYEEACCRGAATPYGKPWGIVAAMLWYYGQGAQYACDEARARLARLIAYSAYLGGASQILWEGGFFDNLPAYNYILSRESWRDYQRDLGHPVLVQIRRNLSDLLNFDRAQQLPLPTVHFGMIQGVNDLYHGQYNNSQSVFGNMSLARSWQLLAVFLPHVGTGRGSVPHGRAVRRWFSWTPFGQVDIVPASGPAGRFTPYRLLAMAGWNTMTPELHHDLLGFVRDGGTLFISLPHFTVDTNQRLEWDFLNGGDLSELAGVRVSGLGPRIENIRLTSGLARGFLADPFALTERNPLFPGDFDELYPVFSQDTTCFAGAVDLLPGSVVHAESESGTPVVIEHRIGSGRVILLNTWFHPGHGRQLEFASGLLRALVRATQTGIEIIDPTERVAWFEYQEAGYKRWMFLNTDWSQAGARSEITVILGPYRFQQLVMHPDPVQIFWDGQTAIRLKEVSVQVRSWKRVGSTSRLQLTGGDTGSIEVLAGPSPAVSG